MPCVILGKERGVAVMKKILPLGVDFFEKIITKDFFYVDKTLFIKELLDNIWYKIDVVSVKRMINSDAANRVGEEVIICNY